MEKRAKIRAGVPGNDDLRDLSPLNMSQVSISEPYCLCLLRRLISTANQDSEAESDGIIRFEISLKELRDLRSQLHHAADYWESRFLISEMKKDVLTNTKEYICKSVVALVDHLGGVSAGLDRHISGAYAFSDMELRLDCLKQRLLSCEQYAHNLALTKLRWTEILPRTCPRYISTFNNFGPSDVDSRYAGQPLPPKKSSSEAAQRSNPDAAIVLPIFPNHTFHFQGNQKQRLNRKSTPGRDILSLIRRTKRST